MNCEDDDLFGCRPKIDRVRKTIQNPAPSLAAHTLESQWCRNDPCNERIDFCGEFIAETVASPLVPTPNLQHFVFGLRPK